MTILVLSEDELRDAVALDLEAIACVERAFAMHAQGGVIMPPILSMQLPEFNGEVDVKTAYIPGFDSFAIKVAPGFFDNPKLGLPSTSGLMILLSARTGVLEALLLDNGYLTDVRTAAAGAIAAKYLARADATRACVVGTGMQAGLQLRALTLVRPIQSATIWGRDFRKARQLADSATREFGIAVSASDDLEAAVSGSDVVLTTTPSETPLIRSQWLQPGQHVTAMGSDQPNKSELEPDCIPLADLYVPDSTSQTAENGELRSAISAGVVPAGISFPQLGSIVSGKSAGRTSDDQITIADLTGTGLQDTAIANFARERALSIGAGTPFGTKEVARS